MKLLLERFMILAYTLHVTGIDIDIDEAGLTVEQFAVIDAHFRDAIEGKDLEEMKAELVELVKVLSQIEPKEVEEEEDPDATP
ncbi:hypothetical protein [Paenibacillus sp. Soil724D2]|uniref:hypothetical protein n=1 Tax=Paenibacillus sp. (strain Soil724D2) TaxID=1736392 RepID=UPI000714659B|nr:hypothetical protein [Paenibacillus sp. Soil724D2]KRE33444.1 hypothetical protein ASG85_14350 [Paenibacillus sp. Soil724D2]